jgi:hypothetical protein
LPSHVRHEAERTDASVRIGKGETLCKSARTSTR